MGFLVSADYNKSIKAFEIAQITEGDATIVPTAELSAQAVIESYLNQLFDVANIFNQTGSARSQYIIDLMVALVVYDISRRLPQRMIPQTRIDDHDIAITTLKGIREGKITPNLPRVIDQHGLDVKDFRFGGDRKEETQTPWY